MEGANAVLSKAERLIEGKQGSSDKDNFQGTPFNDYVEAKITQEFLNKDFFSDKDSDQHFDWEDIHQDTSSFLEYNSFKSYEREHIDIDDASQPKSYQKSYPSTANASITAHAKQKLIQILQDNISIPHQCWGLDKILTFLVIYQNNPKLHTAYRYFKNFAY